MQDKANDIEELLAGYETYSTAEDIDVSAVSDAPATTWGCAAVTAGISWMSGQVVSKTIDDGC
ncbi:LxmA leader domain family RiPP [Solwaraspora sp. WMMD791]|uniref:LxmA leader domain family RiPP n=1 Tax=Solwaraspora sp. WMMD791 TaxID=3016086 RepID=UPI00249C4914|nr:LxmA leader domain family RiPP [Solwaraspora sp. WMMD791]WFE30317.1 LxmA leader domain family RiPP [Solwaraspora sp. WMMD791]